jgi:hypothetical protein
LSASDPRAATYARRIKDQTAKTRSSRARPAAKTEPAAAPKPTPAAGAASGGAQALKDELQRVNREISRLARLTRPGSDAGRNSQLPEKQELLAQRQDLERKIRALSRS